LHITDEGLDSLHEGLNGLVPMVEGDVVVKLLPEALDDVRLRRVRGRKCKRRRPPKSAR